MKQRAWLGTIFGTLAIFASGCGCGQNLNPNLTPGPDGGQDTDGTGGGDSGCRVLTDCPAGQICDTATGTCIAAPGSCATHADCGGGAICGAGSTCVSNAYGGPCVADANCLTGETCIGGICACGGTAYSAMVVAPNVLIVLDKSGSMRDPLPSGLTKWETAVAAVDAMLTGYGSGIYFGLDLFAAPGGASCAAGTVLVDPAPATAAAINAGLAANGPGGATPIGDTLAALAGYAGLQDTTRSNYVLLMTDGNETCMGDGVAAVTALIAQVPEVRTFVVGFGSGVDPVLLDAMAVAGGTARAGGPPNYYQADDAASLTAAFSTIAGSVLSCTYTLSSPPPPDAALLGIFFDGVRVPHDPTQGNGWDYVPATGQLTFYGPACDSLRTGMVADLAITYGCPGPG